MTKRKCSVDGCERPHKAHGYCKSHASRWRKYGGPLNGPTVIGAASAPQRVIAKRFGVARETIRNIYTGLAWHVK